MVNIVKSPQQSKCRVTECIYLSDRGGGVEGWVGRCKTRARPENLKIVVKVWITTWSKGSQHNRASCCLGAVRNPHLNREPGCTNARIQEFQLWVPGSPSIPVFLPTDIAPQKRTEKILPEAIRCCQITNFIMHIEEKHPLPKVGRI